jgi:putative transposase
MPTLAMPSTIPTEEMAATRALAPGHLAEIYGTSVSKDAISAITDRVLQHGMAEWHNRPLDPVCPVIFIDAIRVKVRGGQVVNRPISLALGVTVNGERDIVGLWVGCG